ncbi:thymidylate synthase [Faustovirus]|nr:Thymidylate synthase [Faustovirus]AMN83334.1 thymidylate synthase [Faustovirus]AMN84318.1 thymidylate synthase [Faustovirus]AMN85304.1 thymidylate synthase [Faustovirus]QBR99301.1 thymidylate synthase [Faustovirus mariensis]
MSTNVIILGSVSAGELSAIMTNYNPNETLLVFANIATMSEHQQLIDTGYSWFVRQQITHNICKTAKNIILVDCGMECIRRVYDYVHPEYNYLCLLSKLLAQPIKPNRTEYVARSMFNSDIEFPLTRNGVNILPLLTTKRVPFKSVYVELLWFLSGNTNTDFLRKHGVTIWDGNTSREYLDSRGLTHFKVGDVGRAYPHQWRNFGVTGVDQIKLLVDGLRRDPYDRRHVVTAWNPEELDQCALPACHNMFTMVVDPPNADSNGKMILNCKVNMRSTDTFLGLPFNIASYAMLTHMIAKIIDMKPGRVAIGMCDVHIYTNHVEQAKEQIRRSPREFPKLIFDPKVDKYTTLDDFGVGDVGIDGYDPWPKLEGKMAV